jgi:hypothetical protein
MNKKLSIKSDDCLWKWLLRKVYLYEGVMVTGGLSRVLLGVGGSSFRGEVILPV